MTAKSYYKQFENFRDNYLENLKSEYKVAIAKARNTNAAYHVFQQTIMDKESKRLQNELGLLSRFLIDIRHDMELNKNIEEDTEFNLRFEKIESKSRLANLKLIAEYEGLRLMYIFWQSEHDIYNIETNHVGEHSPVWQGENITEFVQVVYALNKAGRLSNKSGQIEKLVENVARAFNLQLNERWLDNHSSSIHDRDSDYFPEIFDELKQTYKNYRNEQIEKVAKSKKQKQKNKKI